jgi:hypothetical protein
VADSGAAAQATPQQFKHCVSRLLNAKHITRTFLVLWLLCPCRSLAYAYCAGCAVSKHARLDPAARALLCWRMAKARMLGPLQPPGTAPLSPHLPAMCHQVPLPAHPSFAHTPASAACMLCCQQH